MIIKSKDTGTARPSTRANIVPQLVTTGLIGLTAVLTLAGFDSYQLAGSGVAAADLQNILRLASTAQVQPEPGH